MDGVQLKPQKMDAADLAAYQKKEMSVQQLMERYYPTKLQPKVSEEAFRMPKTIAGPEGDIKVEKFNVYKEKDEQRPDYGKYKFYAQMGDTKMSAVASREDLNAYFDRTMSPSQLIEKNFGERLHLKSAYESTSFPKEWTPKGCGWQKTMRTTSGRYRWIWATRARPTAMKSPSMTAIRSSKPKRLHANRLQPST